MIARGIGEVRFAEATYHGSSNRVVFEDGTIVSVEGRDSFGVEEVTIGTRETSVDGKSGYEGAIILMAKETAADAATPNLLPDGEYRLEQSRSAGRARDKFAQKPLATGFEVRDGKIVTVFTNGR